MAYEQKDGTGALFKAREKWSEKSPDYRGQITVDGVTYQLAGWVKETRDGKKYLSLAVSEQTEGGRRRQDAEVPF